MAMTDQVTQIYEHDASIIPILASQLPHSISLLRRIQHGLAYPSPTAKILATFPPAQPPPSSAPDPDKPWLAARVDLFRGRETQIVLYSSLEATHTSIDPIIPVTQTDGIVNSTAPGTSTTTTADTHPIVVSTFTGPPALLEQVRNQLLSLLAYVKKNLLPEYLSSLSASASASSSAEAEAEAATGSKTPHNAANNGVPLIPPPPPQAFLIGTLHTGIYALLMCSGVYGHAGANARAHADADPLPGLRVHRFDYPPYYKYFFRRAVFSPKAGDGVGGSDVSLPGGYRFHDRRRRVGVLASQLDLVQSRTHIPRSRAQLSSMPGVAIYYDGDSHDDGNEEDEMPIAWGFLGLDGALATLHVEPAHRGKGLALCLSREVMRRGMASGVFRSGGLCLEDDDVREKIGEWVHTEAAQYNWASRRVMEKIGGEVLSTVIWTVIEVCE